MRVRPVAVAPCLSLRAARVLAAVCALAVWLLGILAFSPELHGHVHADAGAAQHECAVTLFQHGAENPFAAVAPAIAPVGPAEDDLSLADRLVPPSGEVRLQPSCGPPAR